MTASMFTSEGEMDVMEEVIIVREAIVKSQ